MLSNSKEKFKKELANCEWKNVFSSNDPNIAYDNFVTTYKVIYEKCFPFQTTSCRKA